MKMPPPAVRAVTALGLGALGRVCKPTRRPPEVRTLWHARRLNKPLVKALVTGDLAEQKMADRDTANLVSSLTPSGRHMPVLDLDFPHSYVEGKTEGHGHMYLDVPTTWPRYCVLLFAMYITGNIEYGHFVRSLRRGQSMLRPA